MSEQNTTETRVSAAGKRAARLLFEALSPQEYSVAQAELANFAAIVDQNRTTLKILNNPTFVQEQKDSALVALLDGAGVKTVAVRQVVAALTGAKEIFIVLEVAAAFSNLLDGYNKACTLSVESAQPLSATEEQEILATLQSSLGRSVRVTFSHNSELLGGLIIRSGDREYDTSIRGSIQRLRTHLLAA